MSVTVSAARVARVSSSWHGSAYRDGFARLYCPESGTATVRHSGGEYPLVPRRIYYIPAYTVQDYTCSTSMVLHYVHFNLWVFGGVSAEPLLRCRFDVAPSGEMDYLERFTRLEALAAGVGDARPPAAAHLEMNGIVLQLLAPFVLGYRDEDVTRDAMLRFRPVFEYVDANLHRRVRVSDLAAIMDLERSYFSRTFKRLFGFPPERYVLRRRVQEASTRLRDGDESLSRIAARLGFSDAFHLSKTFRNLTGLSPSEFRRRMRSGP